MCPLFFAIVEMYGLTINLLRLRRYVFKYMKFNITHFKTVNCKFSVNDLIKQSLQNDHISCDRVTSIKCYYIYNIVY